MPDLHRPTRDGRRAMRKTGWRMCGLAALAVGVAAGCAGTGRRQPYADNPLLLSREPLTQASPAATPKYGTALTPSSDPPPPPSVTRISPPPAPPVRPASATVPATDASFAASQPAAPPAPPAIPVSRPVPPPEPVF